MEKAIINSVMKAMRELDEYADEIKSIYENKRDNGSKREIAFANGIKYATRAISREMLNSIPE